MIKCDEIDIFIYSVKIHLYSEGLRSGKHKTERNEESYTYMHPQSHSAGDNCTIIQSTIATAGLLKKHCSTNNECYRTVQIRVTARVASLEADWTPTDRSLHIYTSHAPSWYI